MKISKGGCIVTLVASLILYSVIYSFTFSGGGLCCNATLIKKEIEPDDREMTVWDCGKHGFLATYNPYIFRHADEHATLILGEHIMGSKQIIGIIVDEDHSKDIDQT